MNVPLARVGGKTDARALGRLLQRRRRSGRKQEGGYRSSDEDSAPEICSRERKFDRHNEN